ncbi:insulinase family protein [Patescibacteria group bacterium]|nr:insulinase family protein [Patescibacteria group bacterium]
MKKPNKLKNGMRVHLVPLASTQATTVLVFVRVGSRFENSKVWGGSHFIEHMMFKGTKKRPQTIDISRELDKYGASFNAFTGKESTGYYVKIDGSKANIAVDLLHDMIFNSEYRPKDLVSEKKVILEEMKMYHENPMMHIEDLMEQALFEGTELGKDIIGDVSSIKLMKRSDILKFRDEYYQPSEMVIVVSGRVPKDIMKTLEKTFGKVQQKVKPKDFIKAERKSRKDVNVKIQTKKLEQIQVALAFPTPGAGHKDIPAIGLLSHILGGSMSSRLFIEVRERRGLCYFVRSSTDAFEDVGIFSIRSGLDASRLEEAMKTIFKEIAKIKKNGVTDAELRDAKTHLEGTLKLQFEDSMRYAQFIGGQELHLNEAKTPEERMEEYRKVTKKDILRVADIIFDRQSLAISAIGPFENNASLLKHFPVLK